MVNPGVLDLKAAKRFHPMDPADPRPEWFAPGRRYYPLSHFLRRRFGTKIWRVTVDAGFTCPNVDGSITKGGCVYCDNRSFSPNRRLPHVSVRAQVERGVRILENYYGADRFLVYFQAATNTHAPVDKLKRLYDEALDHPQIIGLVVGTRPDCVAEPVLSLLEEYATSRFVSLELGLQSIHDRSLTWMNRGHGASAFVDAVERCRGRGFEVSSHVILGLPGESHADMLATAEALASLPVDAVKIHNLHVVRDTPLEEMYRAGTVRMLELAEYVALVCDFLERLPPTMVIQRLSGDAPPKYLVAPDWCLDKPALLSAIQRELQRRDSWQGRLCTGSQPCSTFPSMAARPLPVV
jgi:radical SAM protein (TIGR01212 family)